MPLMSCAGCGAVIPMDDPRFSEWWVEHGKCLRREPPPEIDLRVKALLDRNHSKGAA
jgi:hypothetical protein